MCLIIFSPNAANARIRRAVLERGFRKNKDGAGMAYVKDGRVIVSKAYYTFANFFVAYQRARIAIAGTKSPLLIHFRWGTCGPVNHTNTQPLTIYRNRLVMAHNGIFDNLSHADSLISDSVRLSHVIRNEGWSYPFNKAKIDILETMCAWGSKLVFLSATGHHTIINEDAGKWRRGAWYSDGGDTFDTVTEECRVPRWRYSPRGAVHNDAKTNDAKVTQSQMGYMRPNPVQGPTKKVFTPPELSYSQMTPAQRKEFEKLTARAKRLITKFRDPDNMDTDEYQKWVHSPQYAEWERSRALLQEAQDKIYAVTKSGSDIKARDDMHEYVNPE